MRVWLAEIGRATVFVIVFFIGERVMTKIIDSEKEALSTHSETFETIGQHSLLVVCDDTDTYQIIKQQYPRACHLFESLRDSGYEHGVLQQIAPGKYFYFHVRGADIQDDLRDLKQTLLEE